MTLHPLVSGAADGVLPGWSRLSPARRGHVERVADLMESWAGAIGLPPDGVVRWRAVAMLHDALRDESPERLRDVLPEAGQVPDAVLHGPAAARRLRDEGVRDEPLLLAVEFHTWGHPELDRMGIHLYMADWAEPGRPDPGGVRKAARATLPEGWEAVLGVVAAARIGRALERRHPLAPQTVAFWNRIVTAGGSGSPPSEEGHASGA